MELSFFALVSDLIMRYLPTNQCSRPDRVVLFDQSPFPFAYFHSNFCINPV